MDLNMRLNLLSTNLSCVPEAFPLAKKAVRQVELRGINRTVSGTPMGQIEALLNTQTPPGSSTPSGLYAK